MSTAATTWKQRLNGAADLTRILSLRRIGNRLRPTLAPPGPKNSGGRFFTGPRVPHGESLGFRSAYWTAFTMSKIGRYIATTMPPTTTPSTTIMMGSIKLSNALTATSTSAS